MMSDDEHKVCVSEDFSIILAPSLSSLKKIKILKQGKSTMHSPACKPETEKQYEKLLLRLVPSLLWGFQDCCLSIKDKKDQSFCASYGTLSQLY